jgi:aldose 1-epimerase
MKNHKIFHQPAFLILLALIQFSCGNQGRRAQHQPENKKPMFSVKKESFGSAEGQPVTKFTIISPTGFSADIINYGGIVTSLRVPRETGNPLDVVLGFDSLKPYLEGHPYFGCITGRYANRIAGGRFELDGEVFQLARNNGPNHLHGGESGLDKKLWQAAEFAGGDSAGVALSYISRDGEEGYPGEVRLKVTYTLTSDTSLVIDYEAVTSKPTPLNLTHHGYFNLNGQGNGDILEHMLFLNADRYTPVDTTLIPTGELAPVSGTPMDFRTPKRIGDEIGLVAGGYDHNFVLNGGEGLKKAATLQSPSTGIIMEVFTTQPGIQFYTGNFLDGTETGKNGAVYKHHYGLCLETQHFPDSPNQPSFPPAILNPGEIYRHRTVFKFISR